MAAPDIIPTVTLQLLGSDDSPYQGGPALKLLVETVQMNITRMPVVVSFPTGRQTARSVAENRPIAWALDLGTAQEMISLSGIVPDNNLDPLVPSISDLQEIVRTHWATVTSGGGGPNGLLRMHGGARLLIDMGPGQGGIKWFQGIIIRLDSSRVGGTLRWEWKMAFQVTYWPVGMHP
jgi:hypothetical protein